MIKKEILTNREMTHEIKLHVHTPSHHHNPVKVISILSQIPQCEESAHRMPRKHDALFRKLGPYRGICRMDETQILLLFQPRVFDSHVRGFYYSHLSHIGLKHIGYERIVLYKLGIIINGAIGWSPLQEYYNGFCVQVSF